MNNQELIAFYEEGHSMAETGREFNISTSTVKSILKNNNVHIRNRGEQTAITNKKRAYKVNHNYFSDLNPENTYYLGFIAADGTVRDKKNAVKIGLASVDKPFLEEFKEKIGAERPLKDYQTSNGFFVTEFSFSSEQIKKDLAKYTICPRKTYKEISFKNIPDKFKIYFIKGFFDGDGSFIYNQNTGQCMIKITSFHRNVLDEINEYFENKGHVYPVDRKGYSLEFSTLPSINIMNKFYSHESPCLQRKKDKFFNAMEMRIKRNPRVKCSSDEDEEIC